MAFNIQSDDNDSVHEQHEINVTPFIDVMLVLLIIFMVAAPLATVSVPVKLPSIATSAQQQTNDPIYLTLQKDLTLVLGDSDILTQKTLAQDLKMRAIDTDQRILLRADNRIEYGELIGLLNQLTNAGYLKVALVGLEQNSEVVQ